MCHVSHCQKLLGKSHRAVQALHQQAGLTHDSEDAAASAPVNDGLGDPAYMVDGMDRGRHTMAAIEMCMRIVCSTMVGASLYAGRNRTGGIKGTGNKGKSSVPLWSGQACMQGRWGGQRES